MPVATEMLSPREPAPAEPVGVGLGCISHLERKDAFVNQGYGESRLDTRRSRDQGSHPRNIIIMFAVRLTVDVNNQAIPGRDMRPKNHGRLESRLLSYNISIQVTVVKSDIPSVLIGEAIQTRGQLTPQVLSPARGQVARKG
jgi:hypothetical protein